MTGLAQLGLGTGGVWTRQQALAATSRGHVDALLARGEWLAPWPGVYADAGIEPGLEQRAWSALLASGWSRRTPARPVAAAGRLAARLLGLPLVDDRDPATGGREHLLDDVVVPWSAAVLRRDGRVLTRYRRLLAPGEALQLPAGLWVTSPLRTIADCARLLQPAALVCLLDAALREDLVTRSELDELVTAGRWSPGAPALRAAVLRADARAESPHETLTRLVLLPHLPDLVPQHRLRGDRGEVLARFDLADPRRRLAVEADGRAFHAGQQMAAQDQRRDRTSDRYGWRTERCTWFDVRCRPEALVRRVVEAARAQERRHRLS